MGNLKVGSRLRKKRSETTGGRAGEKKQSDRGENRRGAGIGERMSLRIQGGRERGARR